MGERGGIDMGRESFVYWEVLVDPDEADDRVRFVGTMETFAEGDDAILSAAIKRLNEIATAKRGLRCFVVGMGNDYDRLVRREPDVTIRHE